jgi:hypothetical protein
MTDKQYLIESQSLFLNEAKVTGLTSFKTLNFKDKIKAVGTFVGMCIPGVNIIVAIAICCMHLNHAINHAFNSRDNEKEFAKFKWDSSTLDIKSIEDFIEKKVGNRIKGEMDPSKEAKMNNYAINAKSELTPEQEKDLRNMLKPAKFNYHGFANSTNKLDYVANTYKLAKTGNKGITYIQVTSAVHQKDTKDGNVFPSAALLPIVDKKRNAIEYLTISLEIKDFIGLNKKQVHKNTNKQAKWW